MKDLALGLTGQKGRGVQGVSSLDFAARFEEVGDRGRHMGLGGVSEHLLEKS